MDVCVKNGIDKMELSLSDSIRMATLTPAKIVGVDDRKGSLEKGKDADIVIFDKNINVQKTIVSGNIVVDNNL